MHVAYWGIKRPLVGFISQDSASWLDDLLGLVSGLGMCASLTKSVRAYYNYGISYPNTVIIELSLGPIIPERSVCLCVCVSLRMSRETTMVRIQNGSICAGQVNPESPVPLN